MLGVGAFIGLKPILAAGIRLLYPVPIRRRSGLDGIARAVRGTQLAPSGGEDAMLWTVIVLLLLVWVVGFMFAVAGGFIHLLLLVVIALFLFNLIRNRRRVV
jgi:TctA family transporter